MLRVLSLLFMLVALLAPAGASSAPGLLDVKPKSANFGTRAVGTFTTKTITMTNRSDRPLFVYAYATSLPDDFSFGIADDSTCPLGGQLLAPGETCRAFIGFRPSEYFAGRLQRAGAAVTASDPMTGEVLETVTIPAKGTGR